MSFLNSTLDDTGRVDEEQNDLLGGKLLKLLDESKTRNQNNNKNANIFF